jgi:hypothetical protein
MQHRIKCAMAGCLAGLTLTAAAADPQADAVTIGQLAPNSSPANCPGLFDIFSPTVTKGDSYVVPSYGTAITSWSTNAADGSGQMLTLKIFRLVSGDTYQVIAHDGPRNLTGGTVNTFPVNIGVLPGDLIGLNTANAATVPNACDFSDPAFVSPTDRNRNHIGDIPDGGTQNFPPPGGSVTHTNVKAVVKPINTFTLGALTRDKKKGTATLPVEVPVPGDLALSGKGVKSAASAGARTSTAVSGPGTTTLTIKAKGKARKKLRETGKVTVNALITYTPTDGDPSTQTRKIPLRKSI